MEEEKKLEQPYQKPEQIKNTPSGHTGKGLCVALCIVFLALGFLLSSLYYEHRYKDLSPLAEAMDVVRKNFYYYDEQTESDAITGALKGLAAYLEDNYAEYYTPEEYEELLTSNSGNYIGLGVNAVEKGVGQLYISEVFPDTPAEEAGLLAGDRFISANGHSADNLKLEAFLDFITHEEGDTNVIVVERDGQQLTFSMVMREVYSPYVQYRMLEDGIGYIYIKGFHGKVVKETQDALDALMEQGMEKLVIDLRNNPGGVLDTAVEMLAYVLPEDKLDGMLVYTADKNGEGDRYFCKDGKIQRESDDGSRDSRYPKEDDHELDVPLAVLVNGNSASASEVFTGAVMDYDAGIVVGTTTFGKGIVQNLIPLGDGTAIKLTTAHYYTPNGFDLHGKGLEPDVVVEMDEELQKKAVVELSEDNQLQAAIEAMN